MNANTQLRRIRRQLMTPALIEVDPERRGFYSWESGNSIVQPVGRAFLIGYGAAMHEPKSHAAIGRVQRLPSRWRGFAMEGAAMATTVRAALEPWHRRELDRFLMTSGARHGYMSYVGIGWALARLPRFAWPDLARFDPLLSPLILDGYGFHQTFFKTSEVMRAKGIRFPLSRWPGPAGEANQQLMQGVGRGMWFVAGGNPAVARSCFEKLPVEYHESLWAGLGLAVAYAGGRDEDGLRVLAEQAGPFMPWVRQGASFAVEARVRAGTVTAHTRLASAALFHKDPGELVDIVAAERPSAPQIDSGDYSAYEQWRTAVADRFSHV